MTRNVPAVIVASLLSSALGSPFDDTPNASHRQINERHPSIDVFSSLKTVEIPLDICWKVCIPELPARAGGILPFGHPQSEVLAVVGPLDVFRTDLWHLERPQPDVRAINSDAPITRQGTIGR